MTFARVQDAEIDPETRDVGIGGMMEHTRCADHEVGDVRGAAFRGEMPAAVAILGALDLAVEAEMAVETILPCHALEVALDFGTGREAMRPVAFQLERVGVDMARHVA